MEVLVCREADIADGARKVVEAGGVEIGVFRIGASYVAWRNHCPHQGGPICQGKLMKRVEERLDADRRSLGIHYVENGPINLVCPWHGYEFDARTGEHAGLAGLKLASIPVRRRDGMIYVVVPS